MKQRGGTVALQSEAVESSIVGYNTITLQPGYSLFTVTFKNLAGGEFDIKNIKVLTADGKEMNDDDTATPYSRKSRSKITFQKLDLDGGLTQGTDYKFNTFKNRGWCDGSSPLDDNQVTLKNGEGIYILNDQTEADEVTKSPIKLQVSGEVELAPLSMQILPGYSLVGNPTPYEVAVKDIKLLNADFEEMNDDDTATPHSRKSRSKVTFQKLELVSGELEQGTDYKYNTFKGRGWCNGSDPLDDTLKLKPGECVYMLNEQTEADEVTKSPVYLRFPMP